MLAEKFGLLKCSQAIALYGIIFFASPQLTKKTYSGKILYR